MARAALDLGVRELADMAKVSTNTVTRFERGEPLKLRTVDALRRALEAAGVIFVEENGEGAGVRLRKSGARPPVSSQSGTQAADAKGALYRFMLKPIDAGEEDAEDGAGAIAALDKEDALAKLGATIGAIFEFTDKGNAKLRLEQRGKEVDKDQGTVRRTWYVRGYKP